MYDTLALNKVLLKKKNSSVENHTILSNIGLGGSETANKKNISLGKF